MENSYVLQMKNTLFLDLSLWFWGMSECEPGHSVGPEVRPNYVIHCVLGGKGYFEVGEKHFDIKKGQGFLIEPETLIHYKADENEPWMEISVLPLHQFPAQKADIPAVGCRMQCTHKFFSAYRKALPCFSSSAIIRQSLFSF